MYIIKQGVNKKERKEIQYILSDIVDLYGDFYFTKNNVRIPIRDNREILFEYLRKGDKIAYELDKERGIAVVTGWSDKGFRKYVKILTKDFDFATKILKIIAWNIKCDLYTKLKKNNPLIKAFQRNGYLIKGDRGSEVLLFREYKPKKIYETLTAIKGESDVSNNKK